MLWIWNFGFPNKGPSSLSFLITNESAFLFRFLVQSRSIGNHLFYFFCPAGRWWVIVAESARLQRSCCSLLCPTPFPAPHLSLYFHKHVKLSGCWCEDSPAYCKPPSSILENETVGLHFGLLFFSCLYCNLRNTPNGFCLSSQYNPFYSDVALPKVQDLISDALQKRKDQSVRPPSICLLAHLCSHSSINELLAVRRHVTTLSQRLWADRKACSG